jgi:5-methylcytosine-specific restriction protein A
VVESNEIRGDISMAGKFYPIRPTTITVREEIENAISLFEKRMTDGSDRAEEVQLGFQGGGALAKVHWRSDLDLWSAFLPTEKRQWAAFGLGNPFDGDGNSIVVEINTQFEGINRRVGGVFLRNSKGQLFIAHRGSVGGGRAGTGQKAFMADMSKDDLTEIRDGDKTSSVIMIGALDAEDFPARVHSFVTHVAKFKAASA